MKLINAITEEFKIAAQAYVKNEIDLEEFEIRLDLIADHLRQIDVCTDNRLVNQRDRCVMLLNKSRSRALAALHELRHQEAGNRRIFNARARILIDTKLHLKPLYYTIRNSLYLRDVRDRSVKPEEFDLYQQIFILKED